MLWRIWRSTRKRPTLTITTWIHSFVPPLLVIYTSICEHLRFVICFHSSCFKPQMRHYRLYLSLLFLEGSAIIFVFDNSDEEKTLNRLHGKNSKGYQCEHACYTNRLARGGKLGLGVLLLRSSIKYLSCWLLNYYRNWSFSLFSWQVAEEYRLVPDTLYLTVNYIDRYLSGNVMNRQRLQLLGVASMMIASYETRHTTQFVPLVVNQCLGYCSNNTDSSNLQEVWRDLCSTSGRVLLYNW